MFTVPTKEMSLLAALKHHYIRPGQTMLDFKKELDALSVADKDWFRAEFIKAGWNIKGASVSEAEKKAA